MFLNVQIRCLLRKPWVISRGEILGLFVLFECGGFKLPVEKKHFIKSQDSSSIPKQMSFWQATWRRKMPGTVLKRMTLNSMKVQ